MKLALFFSVLLLTSYFTEGNISETKKNALTVVSNKAVNKIFKKLLEELRGVIKNGNKFVGIPPMDPYETGPVQETISSENIRADISALNIGISGFSNYKVTKAEIRGISTIMIGFEWPELKGNISSCNLTNGRLMDFFDIYGNGNAVFNLKNLIFTSKIFLQYENRSISIKTMKSEISLGVLEFFTDSLYDDKFVSAMMSFAISEIGPTVVERDQKQLTDAINIRVINILNKFLRKFTMESLINSITGKIDGIKQTMRKKYVGVRDTIFSILSSLSYSVRNVY
ncbi:uncharacterized protein LOC117168287 isoform X2 [Belonocnema kinseyi]|uniref:uncharacterized protein LOC117168287 isoform X2 n=1 Tax=Belonocnema kinseyi TaxID=2817044 RepID=UPI00143D4150|nr:uncharacterized protein LOC117168287 isoform X2 [Belonocnema kinseyi]